MLASLAVLSVARHPWKPNECGLIGDRLYLQKIIGANGKNFISVSVGRLGGLGAPIAPQVTPLNLIHQNHHRANQSHPSPVCPGPTSATTATAKTATATRTATAAKARGASGRR